MKKIVENIERVILGKRSAVELVLVSLLCNGHVLIEDVPGVGKTTLANALAKSIDCSFKRIQFTPDIMPSDISGFSMYNPKTGDFDFRPGPVMNQFILADEINRTSPKTQSSFLEVMEERQVTVDGNTYYAPKPFMVMATQNHIEHLGTFPLPEAQLDRFFMKISLGYPELDEECQILEGLGGQNSLESISAVADGSYILRLQEMAEQVFVSPALGKYVVKLVSCTRKMPELVMLGASPRASICLYKAAQAWALYNSRTYVIPDDIIKMTPHVLGHRIILTHEARIKKITALDIVDRIIESVNIPEKTYD